MTKENVHYTHCYDLVMEALAGDGLLLGSYDDAGKANVMTIGWTALGSIWGLPMAVVLVRPSRYTYGCIEHSGAFTVNVPTAAMAETCASCGSKSGRDTDKFAECRLTAERGATVNAPVIAECPIVYECTVVHTNDVIPERLDGEIASSAYPAGDYHRVFFGKILAVRAEPGAGDLLKGQADAGAL